MVEVEVFCCTTLCAFPPISFPHLKLNSSWNHSSGYRMLRYGNGEIFLTLHSNKFEFENKSAGLSVLPRVDQMKYAMQEFRGQYT